jgi:hypothetical protein
VEVQAVAVGVWVGKGLIHQMKNICARKAHIIIIIIIVMRVIIFALIGVVFHGPHRMGLHTQPSFKRAPLPLAAVKASVTL